MMRDFWIPLESQANRIELADRAFTFDLTFSNDGGLTNEKQIRKTSV